MNNINAIWVVVANAERGRLLHCQRTEAGSAHVEVVDRIEHHREDYEHQRPSPRKGGAGDTHDDHEDEEEARRFARRLTDWIGNHVDQQSISRLVLFAAPRFLGALRQLSNGSALPDDCQLHESDLSGLTIRELTRHQRITQLLDAA